MLPVEPTPPHLSDTANICRCTACYPHLHSTAAENRNRQRRLQVKQILWMKLQCDVETVEESSWCVSPRFLSSPRRTLCPRGQTRHTEEPYS